MEQLKTLVKQSKLSVKWLKESAGEVLRYRNVEIQNYQNAEVQKHRNTETQKHKCPCLSGMA